MFEEQKDCIAKDTHKEPQQISGCLLICITISVNMDHYKTGRPGLDARYHQTPTEYTQSTCSLNQWVRSLVGLITSAGTAEYFAPLQFPCRNCGGGDRGGVAIYRLFGEFRRAKIALSPVWSSRPTTGVSLAHATMNFVGLDLTTSDR
ncbi:hypothetical protein TNCV_2631041 [Trichonephila clavipes]|nr:hypothetical protein TNCV_2631041 [Trichonephila clavipes]